MMIDGETRGNEQNSGSAAGHNTDGRRVLRDDISKPKDFFQERSSIMKIESCSRYDRFHPDQSGWNR